MKINAPLLLALSLAIYAPVSQAALHDRGNGLLYDDVLNVTWLQDANYAKTSGYDSDGLMTWDQANGWADQLVYQGIDDWRLPTVTPTDTDWDFTFAYHGNTDIGYNSLSPNHELAYMYYVNLELNGWYDANGYRQYDSGVLRDGSSRGQADVGLVKNLENAIYWSETEYPLFSDQAFVFYTRFGSQSRTPKSYSWNAWALRNGDVTPIPEPETYAMLLAGLGMIGFMARRRKVK